LKEEINGFSYEEYKAKVKQTYFKINVGKEGEEREKPFKKQLKLSILSINQVSNITKKKSELGKTIAAEACLNELEELQPVMEKVYKMTERHEILKENVPVEEKIFSIYERHTDIMVKGKRDVQFGHKVQVSRGKSNLIVSCEIVKGNPKGSELFEGTIERVKKGYGKVPKSRVADGRVRKLSNH
jgi:IS5 family transposase